MTAQGSPLARFARAVKSGNLFLAELSAREANFVPLRDALGLLELYSRGEPERYERAAIRWLGRLALESKDISLDDLQLAAAALGSLATRRESSLQTLRDLSR